ncbi:hypothetical protein V6N12_051394 [Hibiscus sabdariffa]|uniref:Uncharacterized protein n=1 Tax=Hibiscus sabdariffa TaxID=183260 RepID=A0ABR2GH17_9ROSI
MIKPIKGPFQWTLVTDMEPILPPIIRRPPGRPAKKRKLEPGEVNNPKLSKRGQQGNYLKNLNKIRILNSHNNLDKINYLSSHNNLMCLEGKIFQ